MASGIPALSFEYSLSGMAWVSDLVSLPWTHHPEDLSRVICQIVNDGTYSKVAMEARDRYLKTFSFEIWHSKLNTITTKMGLG